MAEKKNNEFAVIETGGKQYMVSVGDVVKIEKITGDFSVGDKLTFDNVLLFDDGKETKLGEPYVKSAKVTGELIEEGKGKKIHVIRFRSKSRHHRKVGHRQPFFKVKINEIKA